jgi:hypothetical protein
MKLCQSERDWIKSLGDSELRVLIEDRQDKSELAIIRRNQARHEMFERRKPKKTKKPWYLYGILAENNWIKLGISKDPESRLVQFQVGILGEIQWERS